MRSNAKKAFYYHADANALGGVIETPFHQVIPSQAPLSLPTVGGHAAARTEAFNFAEIISCRSTYTRVSGVQVAPDGSSATLVTSVVEGLNILEVVTAERLIAQISVHHPIDRTPPRISFNGSFFEGLKVGGYDAPLVLNASLSEFPRAGSSRDPITYRVFQETGRQQAAKLIEGIELDESGESFRWLIERYGWMAADREPAASGVVLCSLVDSIDPALPGRSFGHVLDIRDFGRVFFGEVIAYPASVELCMVRVELGCATTGAASAAHAAINGSSFPP